LAQQADCCFEARFFSAAVPVLITDEAPPLRRDAGPNPSRPLLLAVANCLSASLLFALRKFKAEPGLLLTPSTASLVRNEQASLRFKHMRIDIHLGVAGAALKQLDRALAQFEDFCVLTQSVRVAISADVSVIDCTGTVLKAGGWRCVGLGGSW
jgi:organic hydroperoxide reductase OsmC/OhrA